MMRTMDVVNPYLENVKDLEALLEAVVFEGDTAVVDAKGLQHKEINDLMRELVFRGARRIRLVNVFGQRFIGTRLFFKEGIRVEVEVEGFPGNDLGAFLSGHRIVVRGNAQDGVGNTMDDGEIVVHGRAGDVVAMSMRGGRILIRDSIGYRGAIHMKGVDGKEPLLVVGGTAQDFLGEYMAGGKVVLFGLGFERHRMRYIGTGMHGGAIYIGGRVEPYQVAKEATFGEMTEDDWKFLEGVAGLYSKEFGVENPLENDFVKVVPKSKRPYGSLYVAGKGEEKGKKVKFSL